MNLQEIREQWEHGLKPRCVIEKPLYNTYLVVLEGPSERYSCHRYFALGQQFHCSVDAREIQAWQAFQWIEQQLAQG